MISAARREDIVSALRRGTVPSSGLDALAVGIESFAPTLDEELAAVAAGRGGFKAVRGEYGTGKTFFGRWLQERARARGFAATEVQINETETPLHRLETVYRRLVEHLGTADTASGAFPWRHRWLVLRAGTGRSGRRVGRSRRRRGVAGAHRCTDGGAPFHHQQDRPGLFRGASNLPPRVGGRGRDAGGRPDQLAVGSAERGGQRQACGGHQG
jgi:hypothetical protein